jgi:hypothetical protein
MDLSPSDFMWSTRQRFVYIRDHSDVSLRTFLPEANKPLEVEEDNLFQQQQPTMVRPSSGRSGEMDSNPHEPRHNLPALQETKRNSAVRKEQNKNASRLYSWYFL